LHQRDHCRVIRKRCPTIHECGGVMGICHAASS
jgi:hypothetical protein